MRDDALIYETLNRLGINRSHAKLYLQFLGEGAATIAQTARQLNTSRQAIYLLLPTLLDRGLVKEVRHGKRSLYQALPPSQLFALVEDLKARLDDVVPALTNMQTVPDEVPLVTIYATPLAMREWYRHFLENITEGEEFLLYDSGNIDNWYKLDSEFYKNYMEQQVKKQIHLLCLLPERKKTSEFIREVGWSISEYRFTSQPFAKSVEQWIWRDEVCYQTIQGNATNMIVLKSKQLAEFSKKQFMEIWAQAKK
ncbi:MAG: helix-turn-helix domain-containing protein [Candidatus Berkelbacteria bacterium]|nr:helix-turn-helix domain-containing protein [Candidatus Berkelbacteria bacterium]MCR4307315.1 helix-turn-helix domain-containing protein [Candidatus Berkelbacteria bacterium]